MKQIEKRVESYLEILDQEIGSSNDYGSMLLEGYSVVQAVDIVVDSLKEIMEDLDDEKDIKKFKRFITNIKKLEVEYLYEKSKEERSLINTFFNRLHQLPYLMDEVEYLQFKQSMFTK